MSTLPTLDSNRAKRGATVPFNLTWNGGEVSGHFFPGVYTGKFIQTMAEEDIWIPVSALLADWDYTLSQEDPDVPEELRGSVCPTDVDSLTEFVPIALLRAIYSRLLEVMRSPNQETLSE
jgi:hypothetical protein